MKTLSEYCMEIFGEKLYKISINAGLSCPNRDGTLDTRGCIFCSRGGSGDFAEDPALGISEQIERAKARVAGKFRGSRYIAYFQAFTNTYGPIDYLERIFTEAIEREDIAAISIATRPDCLGDDVLELLQRLNNIKPVWVELGLQTIHEKTARYIRRGYPLSVYDEAAEKLRKLGIHTVTHLILYLPGETAEQMLQSVSYACEKTQGIKLQLLHVLRGTDLEKDYEKGLFTLPSLEEYAETVSQCVSLFHENTVCHRLTGDGPKSLLIAPMWTWDKKRVLNTINKRINLA